MFAQREVAVPGGPPGGATRTVEYMTDVPFGFQPSNPDDADRPDKRANDSSGSGQPGPEGFPGFGAMPPGMDLGALGQMLSQLGQALSQSSAGGGGPVNYDLAKQVAVRHVAGSVTPGADQRSAITESVRLAEVWLDSVTTLPAGARSAVAWSAAEWIEQTMPTWRRLADPVANRVSGAWIEAMPGEARQAAGPLLSMLTQMGGLAFGSQLGNGLGQLAGEVLTSTEVGLPLGPAGVAALLPANIEAFSEGLTQPRGEVMVFLAAREAAHQRLFEHVPWLRQRLLATVEEFAHGITIDTSKLEEMASRIDPGNPEAMEEALRGGMLEPETTPEQKMALGRLETLLALVEGWVDVVVGAAVGDRLPGSEALRETLRRRRASGGPAEQTFATLVGLELRPRRLRRAAALWQAMTDKHGTQARDSVWAHPDLAPSSADLDEPLDFVERFGGSSSDPMAELESEMNRPRGNEPPKEGEQAD